MKHDLSECKVGDYICTTSGWERIEAINVDALYPITTLHCRVTIMGLNLVNDIIPIAYTSPPQGWLDLLSKIPCPFKKGDKVLAINERRFFSHAKNGGYYCFADGKDEWSAGGETIFWKKGDVRPWRIEDES